MSRERSRSDAPPAHRPAEEVRRSNPGTAEDHGLEGDLGVSSGRTGPEGDRPGRGVEGTGTRGSARSGTDGVWALPDEPGADDVDPGES